MTQSSSHKGGSRLLVDRLQKLDDGLNFGWSTSAAEVQEVLDDFTEVWGAAYDRDPHSDLSVYCGTAVLRLSSLVDFKQADPVSTIWIA